MGIKEAERPSSMAAAKGAISSVEIGVPTVDTASVRIAAAAFPASVFPAVMEKGQVKSVSTSR